MTPVILFLNLIRIFIVGLLLSLSGCATQSADQYLTPYDPSRYKSLEILSCIDRTGVSGSRNLGAETSQSLRDEISKSGMFILKPSGELMLTCDLERFEEGSAIKRWLWPGWGVTKAKVTVMIWARSKQDVLVVLSSIAKIEAGGLYTIGADQYIINVAVADVVKKLNKWVQGKNDR